MKTLVLLMEINGFHREALISLIKTNVFMRNHVKPLYCTNPKKPNVFATMARPPSSIGVPGDSWCTMVGKHWVFLVFWDSSMVSMINIGFFGTVL